MLMWEVPTSLPRGDGCLMVGRGIDDVKMMPHWKCTVSELTEFSSLWSCNGNEGNNCRKNPMKHQRIGKI
jgi:hypothetical protein